MEHADRNSGYPNITASTNNISSDSIDCGISKLGWCRGAKCQKFASLKWFIIILSIAGILQGAAISYFRISAKQAAIAYGYDSVIVDWLLVSSGIFQALCALFFAHLAYKFHPISWLGGITVLQGVICAIAIIPAVMTPSSDVISSDTYSNALCVSTSQLSRISLDIEQSRMGTLVLLFVLQFVIGMGNLAFMVIGLTYIDDNSQSIDSPAVIGLALCAAISGFQFGYFITMIVTLVSASWWLGWAILAPLIFVIGTLLALFPRRLVKTVLHQTAQRIIEESALHNFGSRMSAFIDDTDFFPTCMRLIKNRLLISNIIGLMFILGGIFNYVAQEENYLRSRFYIPFNEEDGLMDEWNLRFVSYFLMPPCAGTAVLIVGLIISKLKLSARTISLINIIHGLIIAGIFIAQIFVRCDIGPIAGFSMEKLSQPYCSRQCICSPTNFLPVCPENSTVTYFSPCYAGCQAQSLINNVALYEGCSCGTNPEVTWAQMRATEGACNQKNCQKMWILFQVASLSMASILATTLIGKVIILYRSVLPQDKPMAFALQVLVVGLFSFVPAKVGYDLVSSKTCTYWTQNYSECLLRESPLHGDILNILTAALVLFGVLFDILVFFFAKNLNVYNCKVTDPDYQPGVANEAINHMPSTTLYGPLASEPSESPSQPSSVRQLRPAPKPFVFRSPSSVTESSVDTTNTTSHEVNPNANPNGVTYSQVVFPAKATPKSKDDDSIDFRMQPVKADVPLHHLSEQDVRAQLGSLKSFNPGAGTSAPKTTQPELDESRPKSPETDF